MENKPLDPWNLLENTVSLAVELYTTTGLSLQADWLEATPLWLFQTQHR